MEIEIKVPQPARKYEECGGRDHVIDAAETGLDFDRWCAEIEEFVTEMSQALNEINQYLGDTQWPARPLVSKQDQSGDRQTAETGHTGEASPMERLESLKRQLKQRISSASVASEDSSNHPPGHNK